MGTQENVVNQNLVGVSATYTYDLKIEQGIYNQHPYFEVSENNMQTNKNPELFCPFLPFFGPNDVQTLTGTRNFLFRRCFGYVPEIETSARREQQTFGESRFFIGHVAIALGSCA